ncbi:MAG: hypothetical protein ACC657_17315 [Thiohalomonadales bacterium]
MNKLLNKKPHLFFNYILLTTVTTIILLSVLQKSYASESIFTTYIGIDSVNHTAFMYDEHFEQYPENPDNPKTSVIALPANFPFWSLAQNYDVVRRNDDGSIDVLSKDPAYFEMVHHMVMFYSAPNRPRADIYDYPGPFSTGSELTSFFFPKGYAYKLDGGYLVPEWHWQNPANVAVTEKLYLRMNITVDNEPNAYRDTEVESIDVIPVTSDFSIPPGKSKKISPKYPVNADSRIIAVIPHIHDHGGKIKLKSREKTIHEFKPEYQNIPVTHDDMGQGATPLHSHKAHLPVNGLYAWTPGQYGPIIKTGDFLTVESKFNNPHPRTIDNMVIATIFYEIVK